MPDAAEARRAFLHAQTGAGLEHVSRYSFDPSILPGRAKDQSVCAGISGSVRPADAGTRLQRGRPVAIAGGGPLGHRCLPFGMLGKIKPLFGPTGEGKPACSVKIGSNRPPSRILGIARIDDPGSRPCRGYRLPDSR